MNLQAYLQKQGIDSQTTCLGNIKLKYGHKPMQTRLKTVDSLVPMYCGQRELIIWD